MKTSRPQKRELQVAFVVPVLGYGPNRVLTGVSRYAMVNTGWRLHLVCGNYQDIFPALKKAGVDGVFISFIFDQPKRIIANLLAAKLPCIAFQCSAIPKGIPYFTSESFKAGKVIAEHFIDRGFRNFAYYSLTNVFWSQQRMKGFCDRLEEAGYSASIYRAAKTGVPRQDWQIGRTWLKGLKGPVDWLRSLPKPVGLMVCYDGIGYDLIQAAEKAGIRVPEDVAVVSVDNNEILCNAIKPPLSSVELNVEQAGYEAAELLNAIMTGKEVMSSRPILTRVVRVVTRQSSDILAVNDPQVAAALYFIRTHSNLLIQVSDVVSATSISRRCLEKKFRSILKRSILDEIMRVRIEHISNLLLKSGMSIDQIAAASIFDSTSHMIRAFKKYKGVPPRTFRKMYGVI
jgi:LacI family transcriptional regulator